MAPFHVNCKKLKPHSQRLGPNFTEYKFEDIQITGLNVLWFVRNVSGKFGTLFRATRYKWTTSGNVGSLARLGAQLRTIQCTYVM